MKHTGPASTLTPSATTTTTTAGVTTAEAMAVPVAATTGIAVGDVVKIAGCNNSFIVQAINALVLSLRRYHGTDAAGIVIASGAVVTKQTVS